MLLPANPASRVENSSLAAASNAPADRHDAAGETQNQLYDTQVSESNQRYRCWWRTQARLAFQLLCFFQILPGRQTKGFSEPLCAAGVGLSIVSRPVSFALVASGARTSKKLLTFYRQHPHLTGQILASVFAVISAFRDQNLLIHL